MLADSRAQILLTQQQLVDQFSPGGVPTLCLDTEWRKLAGESPENFVTTPKPHNLAYILYTSPDQPVSPKGLWSITRR